jgi:hypothetical protein
MIGFILVMTGQIAISQVLGPEILKDKEPAEIDFEYSQGFIILNLRFSKALPLKFILDTGAEHVILFRREITDILGIEYEKRINLVGSDLEREVYAFICRNVALQLEKTQTVSRDIIVLEEDFLHLEELTGEAIHGILGTRFFRNLIMGIDYKKGKLTLHSADSFRPPTEPDFKKISIEIDKYKPYVRSKMKRADGLELDLKLLIDTGAALPFMLFVDTHPSLTLPDYFVKGNLGKGLGGDLMGYLSKMRELQFTEHFSFNNIITSFQKLDTLINPEVYKGRNGLIGNPILERFHIILDNVNGIMYLKARKNYNKDFKYDKSGLVIYAFGPELNDYYVKEVIEGSPAWNAGIRSGDMIKSLGIWPINFYSLRHILNKLKGREGKKIRMKLERNGRSFRTNLVLNDFLSPKKLKKAKNK